MRFVGSPDNTPVMESTYLSCPEKMDIEEFLVLLGNVSREVGAETRERLLGAVQPPRYERVDGGSTVLFSDTPVYGNFYVYLWFDENGELFYIGKGSWDRVNDLRSRSDEFRKRAEGGRYEILAAKLRESYALDLEKVLIMEAIYAGKNLLNRKSGDAEDGIRYCSGDRDYLLWYWNHLGVIDRFSVLTGIDSYYDARGGGAAALENRSVWWRKDHPRVNNPKILAEIREAEEKDRIRKEKARVYRAKKKEAQV